MIGFSEWEKNITMFMLALAWFLFLLITSPVWSPIYVLRMAYYALFEE